MFTKVTLLAALAAAANALTISTPASLVECQPVQLSWTDGTAPYYPSIIPGGEASASALVTFDEQTATTYTWTVNLASGTNVTVKVVDSTGTIAYSSTVVVQSGSSSACLTETSSADTAASTGSTTVAAAAASSGSTTAAAATTTAASGSSSSSKAATSGSSTAAASSSSTSAASGASALQAAGGFAVAAAVMALVL